MLWPPNQVSAARVADTVSPRRCQYVGYWPSSAAVSTAAISIALVGQCPISIRWRHAKNGQTSHKACAVWRGLKYQVRFTIVAYKPGTNTSLLHL